MSTVNPYERCPVYESAHYTLRLVEPTDANDLLACYSDPAAVRFMNSDNCSSDFLFGTLEQMQACIRFWLREYAAAGYVRFAVVDRGTEKSVGTVEMFGHREPGDDLRTGILRIDLCAEHERQDRIGELLQLAEDHFYRSSPSSVSSPKRFPKRRSESEHLRVTPFPDLPASSADGTLTTSPGRFIETADDEFS